MKMVILNNYDETHQILKMTDFQTLSLYLPTTCFVFKPGLEPVEYIHPGHQRLDEPGSPRHGVE